MEIYGACQGRVKRFSGGRMPQSVHDKPSGLLRSLEVFGESGGGNPLRLIGHQPNRHKPFAERELRVLENRTNLHRKPLPTIAALEGLEVRKVIDATAPAIGANSPSRQRMVRRQSRLACSSGKAATRSRRLSIWAITVGSSHSGDHYISNQIWVNIVYSPLQCWWSGRLMDKLTASRVTSLIPPSTFMVNRRPLGVGDSGEGTLDLLELD